jgi:hypothetical protein
MMDAVQCYRKVLPRNAHTSGSQVPRASGVQLRIVGGGGGGVLSACISITYSEGGEGGHLAAATQLEIDLLNPG